jgi:CHAT domain-containing protein
LWPVADTATALLIAKFYDLHLSSGVEPPTALQRAQFWLRQASNSDLVAYARAAAKEGRLNAHHIAQIADELSEDGLRRSRKVALVEWVAPEGTRAPGGTVVRSSSPLARPYAHPYFCAGFIYTGL